MRPHPEQHWLPMDTYLEAIERESRRFREVLVDQPAGTPVPSCPGWDVDDLLWHLGGGDVQHFWAWIVANRPEGPQDYPQPERPTDRHGILAVLDRAQGDLMLRLRNADPADGCWSWASDTSLHTVAFTMRRQAHEALIHRVDAELAAGERTPLDPHLAADGVAECLEMMYGGLPTWGHFAPDGSRIAVDIDDTGHRVVLGLGRFAGTDPDTGTVEDEDDVQVLAHEHTSEPSKPFDLRVSGTAEDLDLWLWHRAGAFEPGMSGDEEIAGRLRAILAQPIG
ncbi:maleylpyruvate isomerase N-terminal domain-containing protein [Janibacter cremeus]|uniref:Uncharacterized protein (TIGR03083 family) n=1 Tax=Janibacter cremeus TaxID=1285192 RepID=A0A852VVY1_9MICO|nr:maleylpyruvate isomerase N-terminal domain-containing protein [Janibacter cremeus]NYF98434.1 uncharacterized protein (TIGR03083 family) [Janibacter cremeus]